VLQFAVLLLILAVLVGLARMLDFSYFTSVLLSILVLVIAYMLLVVLMLRRRHSGV